MAICVACGAASAAGAQHCASCGRPFDPPGSAIGEVSEVSGGVVPPPSAGGWGEGVPYEPAGRKQAVLRWITGSSWLPALRAVAPPSLLLLVAALAMAVGLDEYASYGVGFGDRYGVALALVLAALGAPVDSSLSETDSVLSMQIHTELRFLPMTVLLAWLLLLWVGLRLGLRERWRRDGQQVTGRQAAGEAARTALLAGAVTALLGLFSDVELTGLKGKGDPFSGFLILVVGLSRGDRVTVSAGWVQATGWTLLLAGLLALTVYGTDVLRWAAWRRVPVRGWLVGALLSGRAMAVTVGLASLVAFVLVAVQGVWLSLAFLPNLGLVLLGLGSGATVGLAEDRGRPGPVGSGYNPDRTLSLFDLHGRNGVLYWALLLAVVGAVVLGWTVYRRRLDTADKVRLAVVHVGLLSLLMLGAGSVVTRASRMGGGTNPLSDGGAGGVNGFTIRTSVGLELWPTLAANLVWTAIAVFGVSALFTAMRKPAVVEGGQSVVPPMPEEPPVVPPPYVTEVLDSHGA